MPDEKDDERRHKDLRDELQLYWLIQLGTITALGALMGTWPKSTDAVSGDAILVKLIVGAVALVLITIAGMYNVVGNYYTFVANYRLGREKQQESVVTPWMALAQSLIAAFLGGAIGAVAMEGAALFSAPSTVNSAQKVDASVPAEAAKARFSITWNRIDFIVQDHDLAERADRRSSQNGFGASGDLVWPFTVIGLGLFFGFAVYGWSVAKTIESFDRQRDGTDADTLKILTAFIEYSKELQKVWAILLGKWLRRLQNQCTSCALKPCRRKA